MAILARPLTRPITSGISDLLQVLGLLLLLLLLATSITIGRSVIKYLVPLLSKLPAHDETRSTSVAGVEISGTPTPPTTTTIPTIIPSRWEI